MKTNQAFDTIKNRLESVLTKAGFSVTSDEEVNADNGSRTVTFQSQENAVMVVWDAQLKKYFLQDADVIEEQISDSPKNLAVWLYDPETSDLADAQSIANDFEDTMVAKYVRVSKDQLATRGEKGKTSTKNDLNALIRRILNTYPQFEEAYKEHMEQYGELLPDTFLQAVVVPYMLDMLTQKKNAFLKKLFEIFNDSYNMGDLDVKSAITVTIFRNLLEHPEEEEFAHKYMDDTLLRGWKAMKRLMDKKDKK